MENDLHNYINSNNKRVTELKVNFFEIHKSTEKSHK